MKRILMSSLAVASLSTMSAIVACSGDDGPAGTGSTNDAGTTTPTNDSGTTTPTNDSGTTTPNDSGTTTPDTGTGPLTGTPDKLVVNEFSVVGAAEWLELANSGGAIDLGNYAIADTAKSDDDAGTSKPKVSDAARFPPGTVLPAGGHLVILLSRKDMSVGPYPASACLPGATAPCYSAVFGVSAQNGEQVHLLGPDNAVIASVAYPKQLSPNASLSQSVCRIPDLTGDFAVCQQSPGAANAQ